MSNQNFHLRTTVSSVFCQVDEEGNVVQEFPVNLVVRKLEEGAFLEALTKVTKAKQNLLDQLNGIERPEEPEEDLQ